MIRYHYKQTPKGILLLHGKTPVAIYPTVDLANHHAKKVTGADATPAEEEPATQSVQPEAHPRGRPKKATDR